MAHGSLTFLHRDESNVRLLQLFVGVGAGFVNIIMNNLQIQFVTFFGTTLFRFP